MFGPEFEIAEILFVLENWNFDEVFVFAKMFVIKLLLDLKRQSSTRDRY
jgi:hypothetical protein